MMKSLMDRAFSSDVEPDKLIFYDFECTEENGKHVANFVVAQSVCNECEKVYYRRNKMLQLWFKM